MAWVDSIYKDMLETTFKTHANMCISEDQANALSMLAESNEFDYDKITCVIKIDKDTYEKIYGVFCQLYYETLSIRLIKQIDAAFTNKEKEEFIVHKFGLLGFIDEHSHHRIYKNILSTHKSEFIKLFLDRKCGNRIFWLYQRDKDLIDGYYSSRRLDFAAMYDLESYTRSMNLPACSRYAEAGPAVANTKYVDFKMGKGLCETKSNTGVLNNPFETLESENRSNLCGRQKPCAEDYLDGQYSNARAALIMEKYQRFLGDTKLNDIQLECLTGIENNGENVLVCAPTGSGKTMISILGIIKCIAQKGKVFYVAPIKALIREKIKEIDQTVNYEDDRLHIKEKPPKYTVIGVSSDTNIRKKEILDVDICVGTPEKLDILLRNGFCYDLIIIDEIHVLNCDRGDVIEAIVSRVDSRIIALSATIPNMEDVRMFLRVPRYNSYYFGEEFRPNKIKYEYNTTEICEQNQGLIVDRAIREAGPCLLFVNERKLAHILAKQILDRLKSNSIEESSFRSCFLDPNKERTTDSPENTLAKSFINDEKVVSLINKIRDLNLFTLITHGICVHHAGLDKNDRHVIEDLFRMGIIKVLVCTTTLAWGINMPCSTVIIYGVFSSLEIVQMCGRAGRSFKRNPDCTRHALGCYYGPSAHKVHYIESHLLTNICFHLNTEINSRRIRCLSDCLKWFKKTFYYQRMKRCIYQEQDREMNESPKGEHSKNFSDSDGNFISDKIGDQGGVAPAYEHLSKKISFIADLNARDIIYSAVKELEESNLVRNFTPTLLGRLSHRYYLKPAEVLVFKDLNQFYDESLILEILENIVAAPHVCMPDIPVPFPTESVVSKIVQFALGGYSFPIDMKSFLQNISRILLGMFEYALSNCYAVASVILKQYHSIAAQIEVIRDAEEQPEDVAAATAPGHSKLKNVGHFCQASPAEFNNNLYPDCSRSSYEDIRAKIVALKKDSVVFISVDLETHECVDKQGMILLVVDSLYLNILYFHSFEKNSSKHIEFYIEDVHDRFLNAKFVSRYTPGVLCYKIDFQEMSHPGLDLANMCYNATHTVPSQFFDYIVVPDEDSKHYGLKKISFKIFNEIMYSNFELVDHTIKVEGSLDGFVIRHENEADFVDKENNTGMHDEYYFYDMKIQDIVEIRRKIEDKTLRLLLSRRYSRDDDYSAEVTMYKCLESKIDFVCLEWNYFKFVSSSCFFVIEENTLCGLVESCVEDLFENLDMVDMPENHLVLFDLEKDARHCFRLYQKPDAGEKMRLNDVRVIFTNDLSNSANIVFSSNFHLHKKYSKIHIVSTKRGYMQLLEISQFSGDVFIYTSFFAYRNIKIQAILNKGSYLLRDNGVCSPVNQGGPVPPHSSADQVLSNPVGTYRGSDTPYTRAYSKRLHTSTWIRRFPSEFLYYIGSGRLKYEDYGEIIKKYTLKEHSLEDILSTVKNGIGLKNFFRFILKAYQQEMVVENLDVTAYLNNLISNKRVNNLNTKSENVGSCGNTTTQDERTSCVVDHRQIIGLKKYIRCIIEICVVRKFFKAIVVSIYALQRINQGIEKPYEIANSSACASESRENKFHEDDTLSEYLNCLSHAKKIKKTSMKPGEKQVSGVLKGTASKRHIILRVYKVIGCKLTFFLFDESFNFQVVEIYRIGEYSIEWPGDVYIACDFHHGVEHIP